MYSRKIGRQDRNEPAISGPHANRSSIIKSESINGNVLAAESVIMTNAYRYSFHASVKQKINVETIPGRARGKNTRNIVCKCPQPSTLAASSISFGTVLKYAISIHIAYGIVNVGYRKIRLAREPTIPIAEIMMYRGMNSKFFGTRYVYKIPFERAAPPRTFSLAIE